MSHDKINVSAHPYNTKTTQHNNRMLAHKWTSSQPKSRSKSLLDSELLRAKSDWIPTADA